MWQTQSDILTGIRVKYNDTEGNHVLVGGVPKINALSYYGPRGGDKKAYDAMSDAERLRVFWNPHVARFDGDQ